MYRVFTTREDNAQCPALLTEPQSAWNIKLGKRNGGLDLDCT